MIIDFDDKELAQNLFFQEEYLSILPLREKVFATFRMYLADFGSV
jgi:uncharacterized protein (DUF1330 family)